MRSLSMSLMICVDSLTGFIRKDKQKNNGKKYWETVPLDGSAEMCVGSSEPKTDVFRVPA